MYEVLKVTRTGKESASVDGFDSLDEDGRDIYSSVPGPLNCPWQMLNVKINGFYGSCYTDHWKFGVIIMEALPEWALAWETIQHYYCVRTTCLSYSCSLNKYLGGPADLPLPKFE